MVETIVFSPFFPLLFHSSSHARTAHVAAHSPIFLIKKHKSTLIRGPTQSFVFFYFIFKEEIMEDFLVRLL